MVSPGMVGSWFRSIRPAYQAGDVDDETDTAVVADGCAADGSGMVDPFERFDDDLLLPDNARDHERDAYVARLADDGDPSGIANCSPPMATIMAGMMATVRGSWTVNVVPLPSSVLTSIVPLSFSMLVRTTSMPTPRPERSET